jgi:hypothetical protein
VSRSGVAGSGQAWLGEARHGAAWLGTARRGEVPCIETMGVWPGDCGCTYEPDGFVWTECDRHRVPHGLHLASDPAPGCEACRAVSDATGTP